MIHNFHCKPMAPNRATVVALPADALQSACFSEISLTADLSSTTACPSMSRAATNADVLCGLPGDVEHPDDLRNYRNAKVGGQPVLPGQWPPESLSPGGAVCRKCGKSLVLVAQVPAPLTTATFTILDRLVTLWACVSQQCANDNSSWKAFTCYLPDSIVMHSKTTDFDSPCNIPDHDSSSGTQQEPAADEGDSWGPANDSWGFSEADNSAGLQCQDAFDFSDLDSALSNAAQHVSTRSSHQHNRGGSKSLQSQHQRQQTHASSCLGTGTLPSSLPGFYLHMTAESPDTSATLSAEEQHIADLVAAYQDEIKEADVPARMETSSDEHEWAGESYEEDKEGAFNKFCMLVQHVPQQCIRYSWGGTPLWPKKQKPSPGSCTRCGAHLIFEMQILAPLMHFLEETCTWMLDDDQDCSGQIELAMQVLSSWQWLTVAVFSCPNECQTMVPATKAQAGKTIWLEQTVILASEE